jgi:tetratricopeptide (TPR) repeat protein
MLINFAAESGLLGLVGVVAFGVFLIKRIWKTWQGLEKDELIRWATICACLLGHLVHTIADQFIYPLATGIPLVVILAILVNLVEQPERNHTPKSIHAIWLAFPALVMGLWGIYSLRAYADFNKGLALVEQDDFVGAVEKFDQAVQQDPGLAYYWVANGYSYGVLSAAGDEVALEKAILNYEQGIAIEPVYSLNYANLGMLYWFSGQTEEAIYHLEQATLVAPKEDAYWLNLGFLYEETGQEEQAIEAYWRALQYKPENASSTYWNQSESRREVQRDWMDYVRENPGLNEFKVLIERGRSTLLVEDFKKAEESFINAQVMRPHDSLSYLGLAELAIARGDLETADRYLMTALSIQSLTYDDKVWPLLTWAQVGEMQGEEEAAFERYKFLYEMVTEYPIDGWGRKGRPIYAGVVFRRSGLPLDVLPQVIRIDLTPELASRLLPLVEMYKARGEFDAARDVEVTLSSAIP